MAFHAVDLEAAMATEPVAPSGHPLDASAALTAPCSGEDGSGTDAASSGSQDSPMEFDAGAKTPDVRRSVGSGEAAVAPKGAQATSFVRKLYEMVSGEHEDVVCFVQGGAAFEVRDPKRLEQEVLPRYFRHSRFQSLVRQLNFYSFKKISKERAMWVYQHAMFHRDHPEWLQQLKRKPSSTPGSRRNAARAQSKKKAKDKKRERNDSASSEEALEPKHPQAPNDYAADPHGWAPAHGTSFGAHGDLENLLMATSASRAEAFATRPSRSFGSEDDERTSPAISDDGSDAEPNARPAAVDTRFPSFPMRSPWGVPSPEMQPMHPPKKARTEAFGDKSHGATPGFDPLSPALTDREPALSPMSAASPFSTRFHGLSAMDLGAWAPTRPPTPDSQSATTADEDEGFVLPHAAKRSRSGSDEFWRVSAKADLSGSMAPAPCLEPQPAYVRPDPAQLADLAHFLVACGAYGEDVAPSLIAFLTSESAEPLANVSAAALLQTVRVFLERELSPSAWPLRASQGGAAPGWRQAPSVREALASYQKALDPGKAPVDPLQVLGTGEAQRRGAKATATDVDLSGSEWALLREFLSFAVLQLRAAEEVAARQGGTERVVEVLDAARGVWLHRTQQFV